MRKQQHSILRRYGKQPGTGNECQNYPDAYGSGASFQPIRLGHDTCGEGIVGQILFSKCKQRLQIVITIIAH